MVVGGRRGNGLQQPRMCVHVLEFANGSGNFVARDLHVEALANGVDLFGTEFANFFGHLPKVLPVGVRRHSPTGRT